MCPNSTTSVLGCLARSTQAPDRNDAIRVATVTNCSQRHLAASGWPIPMEKPRSTCATASSPHSYPRSLLLPGRAASPSDRFPTRDARAPLILSPRTTQATSEVSRQRSQPSPPSLLESGHAQCDVTRSRSSNRQSMVPGHASLRNPSGRRAAKPGCDHSDALPTICPSQSSWQPLRHALQADDAPSTCTRPGRWWRPHMRSPP